MKMAANPEIEKYFFEKFSKDYALPSGTIVYGDGPDVVIEGQRRIGIEITSFFLEEGSLPQSEQVQRKLRDKVVLEAQKAFLAPEQKGIEITFGFKKSNPIRDKKGLVKAIVELANQIRGWKTGVVNKDVYEAIPELDYVYLNAEQYDNPKWRAVQPYKGQMMSRDRLLDIVKAKEMLSANYKPCDAYWLLVVVDFIDPAQDQEIRFDGFDPVTSNIFEKVIVYKTGFGHIFEAK
jgi:hypothetical protein